MDDGEDVVSGGVQSEECTATARYDHLYVEHPECLRGIVSFYREDF